MNSIDINEIKDLTERDKAILERIVKKDGTLRKSKPPVPKKTVKVPTTESFIGHYYEYDSFEKREKAEAAYVWRMLAFHLGMNTSMPVTADFWLEGTAKRAQERAKELDKLVDKVLNSLPVTEQVGTLVWGKALGFF